MVKENNINNSKLFNLIDSLDKKEFAELGKWLRSPFHNRSEKVIKLYEGIKTKHRNTGKPISELILLKYIGLISSVKQKNVEPQHRKELKDVMHKLTLQIQDYIVWKKIKQDSLFVRYQLMDALLERGMHRHILPLITKSQKELQVASYQDISYCEHLFRLKEMRFYLNTILNGLDAKKLKTSIEEVIVTLRQYSLSNLLRYYCSAVNLERILDIQQEYPLRKAIREHLDYHFDNEQPSVGTYYRMLKLFINREAEDYYEFKNFLFNNLKMFDLGEIRSFFNSGVNFCTQMIKQGNQKFIYERYLLHKKGLELECWSQNSYFPQHLFIQIVQNSLLLNKVQWTNSFINQYAELLKKEIKNIVMGYCNALVYHHDKQYEKALYHHLPTQELPPDFSYYLHIKILEIKIRYDSDDWGDIPISYDSEGREKGGGYKISNELENIRKYISHPNKEIAQNIREQYTNFVSIFGSIFNRKRRLMYPDDTPVTQANLQNLQTKLINTSPIVERKWLEEKITELIQKTS